MTPMLYLVFAALLPLAGFLVITFFGRRIARFTGILTAILLFGSFGLSVGALILWVDRAGFNQPHYAEAITYRWMILPSGTAAMPLPGGDAIAAGPKSAALTVGILADSLTVAMFLLVTFLSAVVQLYSLVFMAAEARGPRFYALVNLLCFAMLALLLSDSLVQFLVFWQMLGAAGWLLMHFHGGLRAPVIASLRMFVFNRVGDAAFLVGLGLLALHVGAGGLTFFDAQGASVLSESVREALGVGSSEFLRPHAAESLNWLTWSGICFFIAALIRSGQFPFQTWLADTAEAPAPAAALLQTCTMAASAIFLLARLYPILTLDVRLILAVVGCVSVATAALVACVQNDIRRVLAWTTVSQVGYMLLFLGAGAYTAGLLHLFTHAFLKTGLLLAAGSVLLVLQNQSDLRQMGGLWKRMPITAAASLVTVLALAGMPWLAGAYSGNLGLACVHDYAAALRGPAPPATTNPMEAFAPQMLLFWVPLFTTYVTAFAIGRWWWLIFVSRPRNAKLLEEAHESVLMTFPVILLAGFSIGLFYKFVGVLEAIDKSLPPTVAHFALTGARASESGAFAATALLTAIGPVGVFMAFLLYFTGFAGVDQIRRIPLLGRGINWILIYLREGFFLEALYEGIIVNAVLLLARGTAFIDRFLLRTTLRLTAFLVEAVAHLVGRLDVAIDRPGRTAALLLTPAFRRLLPSPRSDHSPPPSM